MATEKDLENADFLKTHSLYIAPGGELIPVVIIKDKHPLTSVRLNEPIFAFYDHVEVVKTRLNRVKRNLEDAEKHKHN